MAKNKNMFKTIVLIITLNILINISITKSTPHKSQNDLPSSIGINEVKIGHNNNNNHNNNKILDDEVISNENDYSDNDDDDFDDESDTQHKTQSAKTVDEQIKLLTKQLNALTDRRQDDLKSLESNLRKYVRKNAVQILNEDLKRELEDLR